MHIFGGCLLAFLLLGFVVLYSIVKGFFRLLFGGGGPTASRSERRNYSSADSQEENGSAYYSTSAPSGNVKRKIIDEDEGEYVEFEEIKET